MKKFYQITNKSFSDLDVDSYKGLWDKVKGTHKGLCACVNTEFTKAEGSENKFDVIMSTATEDRHGDVVKQNWDLKAFKKNPVFLDSHNYDSIEHIIGKVSKIGVKDGKLKGQIEFMLDNPKGLLAYKMALGGFLNATSVGFIPKLFDDKGNIVESELLEDSAVSVPANSEALFGKSIEKKDCHDCTEEEKCDVCFSVDGATEDDDKDTGKDEGGAVTDVPEDTKISDRPKRKTNKQLEAMRAFKMNQTERQSRKKELYQRATNFIKEMDASLSKKERKSLTNKAVMALLKANNY